MSSKSEVVFSLPLSASSLGNCGAAVPVPLLPVLPVTKVPVPVISEMVLPSRDAEVFGHVRAAMPSFSSNAASCCTSIIAMPSLRFSCVDSESVCAMPAAAATSATSEIASFDAPLTLPDLGSALTSCTASEVAMLPETSMVMTLPRSTAARTIGVLTSMLNVSPLRSNSMVTRSPEIDAPVTLASPEYMPMKTLPMTMGMPSAMKVLPTRVRAASPESSPIVTTIVPVPAGLKSDAHLDVRVWVEGLATSASHSQPSSAATTSSGRVALASYEGAET